MTITERMTPVHWRVLSAFGDGPKPSFKDYSDAIGDLLRWRLVDCQELTILGHLVLAEQPCAS